jgi:uncharacterized protein
MIHKEIKDNMKKAMLAKEAVELEVLRGLLASFTNELVSKKRKPYEELSDDEAIFVIKKEAKKRKDSIEQFTKGGRPELAKKEREELSYLSKYTPEEMSPEEIKKIALAKKEELEIIDKSNTGRLVGEVMKEIKGNADGNTVKDIVSSLFD